MSSRYDLIVVGTGFAGAFFLMRYLEHAPAGARVLERGARDTKAWQLQNRRSSSIDQKDVFVNATPVKDWYTSPGYLGYYDPLVPCNNPSARPPEFRSSL
jgi:hypothetical protein